MRRPAGELELDVRLTPTHPQSTSAHYVHQKAATKPKQRTMGRSRKQESSPASFDTQEKDSDKGSMFQRLFAPMSADTSVSSASDERSLESHSNVSMMSGSSNGSDESSCSSSRSAQRFDRELRAKHRGACKYMTVSSFAVQYCGALKPSFDRTHTIRTSLLRMVNMTRPSNHSKKY